MDGVVLTLVINKLSDLLDQKVGLIAGAEDEIRSLRDELSLLTIFLGGINDQSGGTTTALAQELMQQLRRVSWKAEDVVDQYLLDAARHESKQFVKKVFTGCGMLSRKGELAEQAQDIKKNIEDILRNKEKYGVRLDYGTPSNTTPQNGENALDRRRRNVEEEDVVGFDQQFREVMDMLTPNGGVEVEELRVVSIIGMGGLGKTTLARKIFKSEEIRINFGTKVWVVVSEHAEAKHVLKNVLQIWNVNIEKDDDDYLKEKLKERINGKKYMIVLDDLWTPKQWEEFKLYFPIDQKKGSRILLTSRIENVAYAASTDSTTYHLKPLGNADSWSLFCKKTLKGKECPSNLVDIGKGIVSKCKGLPLAIIVLGGLLSAAEAEPSKKYWSKILDDTSWHPDADNDCSKILSMSYHNLPPLLRTCFLYVGVFPEDFEIQANELCLLWVVEGFVDRQSREVEEDVAEKYLINLVDRNLIMISKRKSDGSIKSCRIHDLLRDLSMKEAERCNLYKIGAVGAYQNVREDVRRMTVHKSDHTTLFLPPALRTLLEFANRDGPSDLRSVFEQLSVLRVLRLLYGNDGFCRHERRSRSRSRSRSDCHSHSRWYNINCAPPRTALVWFHNLMLLRYLKFHHLCWMHSSGISITRHISNLSNLQVLNLKSNVKTYLPKGIWKLKLLRHVYVRPLCAMPDAGSSNDSLPHMQTLSCIQYEEHTAKMLSSKRFPNLRKLWVHVDFDESLESLRAVSLQSVPELVYLLAMKITFYTHPFYPILKVALSSINIVAFPSTLTKIHLKNTVLTSDHWRLLGELENLQVLKLSTRKARATSIEERFQNQPLVFETEGFPQLVHLKLGTLHPALTLRDGALRALHYLIICPWAASTRSRWSALPDQLWLSTTLRQVKVIRPSKDMIDYIQNLDDSKRSMVTICCKELGERH